MERHSKNPKMHLLCDKYDSKYHREKKQISEKSTCVMSDSAVQSTSASLGYTHLSFISNNQSGSSLWISFYPPPPLV